MAAYYTSQAFDVSSAHIWGVLTDFASWPAWFPRMSEMRLADVDAPGRGAELLATANGGDDWTRWLIAEWSAPRLLLCEFVDSNVPMALGVQAAYLQFELNDDDEGCVLEVELGAQGSGIVGDFFVGMTLGPGARRILPELVDAFSEHVVQRATSA